MEKKHREGSNKLTIFILNFNGEHRLKECLESVFAQQEMFNEIVLVDNASADESLKIVKELFPTVKIVRLDKNIGIGGGKNAGFKAAAFDRILYLDNDITLAPNCIDQLMQALDRNPRAAVAMPCVLYAHKKDTIQYDGADVHFLGMMALHNQNQPLESSDDEVKQIGSVVGCCFLSDRKRLGKVEPFDESFFYCFDDLDFSMKVRSLGYEILSLPFACCYHGEGTKGISLRGTGKYTTLRIYNTIRNRWMILLKNYELKTLFFLFPILLVYEIFQFAGIIKKGWLREWLKSVVWILANLKNIFKKRGMYQRERMTPDREILQNVSIPFNEMLTTSNIEKTATKALDRLSIIYWNQVFKFL